MTANELVIRVDFTISVPAEYVPALIELAATRSRSGAREFVQAEAEENLFQYLENNGVWPASVRGKARPGGAS